MSQQQSFMTDTPLQSQEFDIKALLKNRHLVVASNREPFTIKEENGKIQLQKTTGGLVSALDPVLQASDGLWVCWDTISIDPQAVSYQEKCRLAELNHNHLPYGVQTVPLTEEEIKHYYFGFANGQLWPLFHYFPFRYAYNPRDWQAYCDVNQKFARAIAESAGKKDLIWVQDYQLMRVPQELRALRPDASIGFFCHIPFPHFQLFRILPNREAILRGMLGSDLIGFHTPEYAQYFMECTQALLGDDVEIIDDETLLYQERRIKVGSFPIGIDFEAVDILAQSEACEHTLAQLRQTFPVELIGIGVDRLDYTKGILERLEAIALFFERYPEYRKRLVFIQIAVPSRTEVAEYQQMKEDIDQAVGRINGELSEDGWSPIHYNYRSFPLDELVAYYQLADFALVNPLRDGMNLVAKEYCAAKVNHQGALILSEMTGASHQMQDSFFVNPYDMDAVVNMIYQAITVDLDERKRRMANLREGVCQQNINVWVQNFLAALDNAIDTREAV